MNTSLWEYSGRYVTDESSQFQPQLKSVASAVQTLSVFQFSSCEKWAQWRNSVMDRTGRTLKINSHRLGWVGAPSLFILVRVSMGAQWWNQKREEKIKQSWTGQCIWLGLPWLQSAWMQINSTLSTQGGMQPFCLRFGEEVNTFISQLLHHSTTHGIEGDQKRRLQFNCTQWGIKPNVQEYLEKCWEKGKICNGWLHIVLSVFSPQKIDSGEMKWHY